MSLGKEVNETVYKVIGSCMEVHKIVGPGFPVEFYHKALEIELADKAVQYEEAQSVKVKYKDVEIGSVPVDFLVNECVILMIRSDEQLRDIEVQQILRIMSQNDIPVGLLMNFGNTKVQYKRVLPSRQGSSSPPMRKDGAMLRPLAYREMGRTREGNPLH
ncbi:GxxExxY protein [candidate division KSB1 bacterium]|nr:GxxExxY protein [candidate division KSB1 bacterium]